MLTRKGFMLFFACLLIIAPNLPNGVEAKQVLTIHKNGDYFVCIYGVQRTFKGHIGYPKRQAYSTLGLVCKCCDGKDGECRSIWDADACSNLKCNPWKY